MLFKKIFFGNHFHPDSVIPWSIFYPRSVNPSQIFYFFLKWFSLKQIIFHLYFVIVNPILFLSFTDIVNNTVTILEILCDHYFYPIFPGQILEI